MKHPEVFLVPVLMFLDYFLTVAGAILRAKKHSDHIKLEHYELNPLWQKTIAQKRWFNLRHTLITVGIFAYLFWFANYLDMPEEIINGVLGCLITCFGMIVGKHIANLLIFRYYIRNPDAISGQITLSHASTLATSTYQYITVLVPIILIAVASDSSFAYGGVGGICLLLFWHFTWRLKHKRQIARQKASVTVVTGK